MALESLAHLRGCRERWLDARAAYTKELALHARHEEVLDAIARASRSREGRGLPSCRVGQ
jgi:hypothetical protein